jgi:hypothetical protein
MKHSNVPPGEKSMSLRNSIYEQDSENRPPLWQFWRKRPRPTRIAAIAGVAALALSVSPISLAAAESGHSESATLIAALPAYTCPAGTVKLTPVSAHRTAHGADVYHYAMTSGPGFDSYVPPAGFNPLAASNSVLSEMNLPLRPARDTALSARKTEVSGYKGTKKPELCESPTPFSAPAGKHTRVSQEPGETAGDAGSGRWAGYVDTAGRYTAVGAYWHQTTASNADNSNEVTWVGLRGVRP